MVAAVALTAGCSGGATTRVAPPPSAPATNDAGAGSDGGASARTCPAQPSLFAAGAVVATSDADSLYAFAGGELLRLPLDGGAPALVVDGIDTSAAGDATADERAIYWRVRGADGAVPALMRADKSGGAATELGSGGGDVARSPYVVADPIYFVHGGVIHALPRGDGDDAPSGGHLLTANGRNAFYLDTGDALRIHALPTRSPPRAHSVGFVDADDDSIYVLWNSELRRYAIANSAYIVLAKLDRRDLPSTLRVAGDRVYMLIGWPTEPQRLERVGIDGTRRTVVAEDASEPWTLAGDSVYFMREGNIFRICR